MKKRINLITLLVFLIMLYSLTIFNAFSKDKDFSENENRFLASKPEFKIDSVLKGDYNKNYEKYIQDQFIGRDKWIMVKSLANKGLLKLENNGVYFGDDNYLMSQYILNDDSRLNRNIEALNNFKEDFSLMIVPSSCYINKDKLNKYSFNSNQEVILDNIQNKLKPHINYIDVSKALENQDAYFKLDHHWNHLGSYIGYKEYMNSLNIKPNEYTFKEVSDNFKGTLYSKSGAFYLKGEKLYKTNELDNLNVIVTIDEKDKYRTLYFEDNLNKKDQYTYYLDGNHSIVKISNLDNKDGDNLLIIKDSYSHIFAPYLVPHFKNIILIDLRYYKLPITDLMKKEKIDQTLVLYSLDNLTTDTNLGFLK